MTLIELKDAPIHYFDYQNIEKSNSIDSNLFHTKHLRYLLVNFFVVLFWKRYLFDKLFFNYTNVSNNSNKCLVNIILDIDCKEIGL